MISIPVRIYVYYKAIQWKMDKPKGIGKRLNNYRKSINSNGYIIVFSCFQSALNGILNADSIIPKIITISPRWAVQLILFDSSETRNAFLITIGHELTHKDGDFSMLSKEGPDRIFISWVNEVHADFGAAEKMVNGCKQKLLDSINYKSEINESIINSSKLNKNEKNRKLGSHPSWSQRKKYVERGTFDDELIKEIAKTTGCYNTELIKKVREYYKSPIILQ